jgi:1-acyl-sn-glycerol-3-phosphate acyltransferase
MESKSQTCGSLKLRLVQALMGFGAHFTLNLLYLRKTHGLKKIDPRQKYIFACNHVSLLDTIMLGGLLWNSGNYPILVLGDKKVWDVSWLHRALSRPIGFLVERGKLNPNRINELERFAGASKNFQLVIFPEGTRGNGVDVAECQPGIFYVAQKARVPIVPIFIENMQFVSTKTGKFHPFGGLKKVEIHFGEAIVPENYLHLTREEFTEFVRGKIAEARNLQPSVRPVAIKTVGAEISHPN